MDSVYEGEKRMSKMTLDAAIIHAKELSESQLVCKDCREGYKQFAEWLEELKRTKDKECETSAREMFKSLGYEYSKERDNNEIIEYCKGEKSIFFWIRDREFCAFECGELKCITVDEFYAIQQQMKELGWL